MEVNDPINRMRREIGYMNTRFGNTFSGIREQLDDIRKNSNDPENSTKIDNVSKKLDRIIRELSEMNENIIKLYEENKKADQSHSFKSLR